MWKVTTLEARTSITGAVDTDLIAVFQDGGKKAIPPHGPYAGMVEKLRKGDAFSARAGSVQFARFTGKNRAENSLLVGMGAAAELTEEKVRQAGGSAWSKLVAEKVKNVVVHVDTLFAAKGLKRELAHVGLARAFAEGLVLGAYQFNKHKSKVENPYLGPSKVTFLTEDKSLKQHLDQELEEVRAVAESVTITRDWSNEPSNVGTPQYYANEARRLAKQYGLKCKVLSEAECAREKMGLFLAVGNGSERDGCVVVLEYAPKGVKNPKTIALVGKGITFDSGGISLKPGAGMEQMKHDMTGAATVMGAIALASMWGVSNRIVAIMAFTENMPSGRATQPGNIVKARNGKTVEINNTDAEGRLILADVLDYAHDFKPDAILDIATLTGAVSVALGKQCCAVLGNDDQLVESVRRAGEINGERTWQLPLWDEYFEDMKSDAADMKNIGPDGNGGTIRGAIFLKQFIKKDMPWVHLDIAATAWNLSHLPYFPKKGAAGIYVRTLAQFAADF